MTRADAARVNGRKGGRPRKIRNPSRLPARELLFVEAYCGVAGYNATTAYRLAGFRSKSRSAASTNASHLMARDRVAKAIARRLGERIRQVEGAMDGDEALKRIAAMGRGDIRKVLPVRHPLKTLPDDAALLIRSVSPTPNGLRVEIHDALRACELVARATGKLKDQTEGKLTLEEFVAGAHDLLKAERAS